MKQKIVRKLRDKGYLVHADTFNYFLHLFRSFIPNLLFSVQHPDFAIPPRLLRFDAYGHLSSRAYKASGLLHAQFFNDLLNRYIDGRSAHILEWGCGSGRIIRHLSGMRHAGDVVSGVDVDGDAVTWCQQELADISVRHSGTLPPIPFEDGSFDAIYSYSVLTHLSDTSIRKWIPELCRILKPGGVLIVTTHGKSYMELLMPEEREYYMTGKLVTRTNYEEGRKLFLSFHPESYMHELLAKSFSRYVLEEAPRQYDIPQDIWVAIK